MRHYYLPDDMPDRQLCPNYQRFNGCNVDCPRYRQGDCPCDLIKMANGRWLPFLPKDF